MILMDLYNMECTIQTVEPHCLQSRPWFVFIVVHGSNDTTGRLYTAKDDAQSRVNCPFLCPVEGAAS